MNLFILWAGPSLLDLIKELTEPIVHLRKIVKKNMSQK